MEVEVEITTKLVYLMTITSWYVRLIFHYGCGTLDVSLLTSGMEASWFVVISMYLVR